MLKLLKCKPKHVGDFNYFNKLKFYSVKQKSVHVLVNIENLENMQGEKLKIIRIIIKYLKIFNFIIILIVSTNYMFCASVG